VSLGHLICADGISGDLLLGAVIDAGAPLERLQDAVDALDLGPVTLRVEGVHARGLACTAATVDVGEGARRVPTWNDARSTIEGAGLAPEIRARALRVARRLAEAEATVHGATPDDVHYHELGDPDTLADIVGTVTGLTELGVDDLTCGPVTVGGGTVRSHHGELPVPAPAVAELLRGFVITSGGRDRELATPTGAAVLAALATPVDGTPEMRLGTTGRGAIVTLHVESVLTLLVGTAP
jgi:pyridinium-3,5-bisthiocarboxylic acid mononucleotide nickel chelatase